MDGLVLAGGMETEALEKLDLWALGALTKYL